MSAKRKALWLSAAALILCGAYAADDPKQGAVDWSKGGLYGRVVDATTGKPLEGATIALRDKDGKVVAWTKSDAQGQYALAADSLGALQLKPSRRRSQLERLAHGAGQLVAAPVKIVAGAVKQVDPVGTTRAIVTTAVTASPTTAVAAQALDTTRKALVDQTKSTARQNATRAVMGERTATPKEKRETLAPGEVFVAVVAPGFKDLKGRAGAFWLEPSSPAVGVRAFLETVKLAPATAPADKKGEIENAALLLSDAKLEPGLAPAGSSVKLSVKLTIPGNQPVKVRVFARESRKRTVAELTPQKDAPGVFAGELALDPELKDGDTIVTLVALRVEPVEVNLKENKADPLKEFARELEDLDPDKPYDFDPRIMASENRLELPLTVLEAKKATPPGAAPAK